MSNHYFYHFFFVLLIPIHFIYFFKYNKTTLAEKYFKKQTPVFSEPSLKLHLHNSSIFIAKENEMQSDFANRNFFAVF